MRTILVALIGAGLFLALPLGCASKPEVRVKAARGELAPIRLPADFAGSDPSGHRIALADFRGKVVLVDFWATTCVPCVKQLPAVKGAYDKYHGRGFEVVGVTIDDDAKVLAEFTKERGMPWPQIFDPTGALTNAIVPDGHGIPMTLLVSRDGTLLAADIPEAELDAAIEKALAGG